MDEIKLGQWVRFWDNNIAHIIKIDFDVDNEEKIVRYFYKYLLGPNGIIGERVVREIGFKDIINHKDSLVDLLEIKDKVFAKINTHVYELQVVAENTLLVISLRPELLSFQKFKDMDFKITALSLHESYVEQKVEE